MLYKEYFANIDKLLKQAVDTQGSNIEKASSAIAESIKNDGVMHMFGCGHSQMFGMEMFYRAGGLVPVNCILAPQVSLYPHASWSTVCERQEGLAELILNEEHIEPGDIMFITSIAGRNALPYEIALGAKNRGCIVIGMHSKAFADSVTPRHSSGKFYHELCDILLDVGGVPGDASLSIEGFESSFAPTSSVVGFAILQSIEAQVIENLVKDGVTPPVFVSGNLDKGDEIIRKYVKQYKQRIPGL
ncbi:MAG: SIS domain-containing protein [Clostridiaceae bacterium]|nr:SIS domain-containing protein [Clostridiaceae bacterium]